jgi:hypothetical protein
MRDDNSQPAPTCQALMTESELKPAIERKKERKREIAARM